jgi:hypothetical protein
MLGFELSSVLAKQVLCHLSHAPSWFPQVLIKRYSMMSRAERRKFRE